MARPKKTESEIKSVWRTFRMTPNQAENFQRLADETNMSRSQLARTAAIGMKQIYISDELVGEARTLSRRISQVGNLLRLHATLLEVIAPNPSLTPGDREEILRIRELLTLSAEEIRELRNSVTDLRAEVRKLTHGNL